MRKSKGITLIALIITIIVLLILAGVSISMVTGDNGILMQTQKASTQTRKAGAKEAVETAIVTLQAEYMAKLGENVNSDIGETFTIAKFDSELEKMGYKLAHKKTGETLIFGNSSVAGTDFMTSIESTKAGDENKYQIRLLKKSNSSVVLTTFEIGDVEEALIRRWVIEDDVSPTGLSIGDKISYGTEKFYVINNPSTNEIVKLLAEKNINPLTLKQANDAPTVAFSNTNYWLPDWEDGVLLNLNEYNVPLTCCVKGGDGEDCMNYDENGIQIEVTSIITTVKDYGMLLGVKGRLLTREEENMLRSEGGNMMTILEGKYEFGKYLNYWEGSARDHYRYSVWFVLGSRTWR